MLMKALVSLIEKWACRHKWKLLSQNNVYEKAGDSMPHTVKKLFVCTECGKFKKVES